MSLEKTGMVAKNTYLLAWVLALVYYALEYGIRSSPSVTVGELKGVFGVGETDVSNIVGAYYITYSVTSLAAGLLIDRIGVKYPLFWGIVFFSLGCFLFTIPSFYAGYAGRLLQGAGSAIAFPAAVYIAVKSFSTKNLATAIGITQTLGMLGGSAGQKYSNVAMNNDVSIQSLWWWFTCAGLVLAVLVVLFTPKAESTLSAEAQGKKESLFTPYKIVFSNPKSYLCGIVAGLLFAPTTIFAMIWGVEFLQRGSGLDHESAAIACALVPVGWAVGCPLLGWLADKLQRRNLVLQIGALVMILALLQLAYFPDLCSASLSLFVMGVGSGAAMLPYSTIKEVNPDSVKGSATGGMNFLTFGVTTLLGPVFTFYFGSKLQQLTIYSALFHHGILFFVGCVFFAVLLSVFLKNTAKPRVCDAARGYA